jgi:hypothetical protein
MKTRSFFNTVLCNSTADLTEAQKAHVQSFSTRAELIAEFEGHDCDWCEADVAPRAYLKMTIKVSDVLQHNPNEGVWVYGASDIDIARVRTILGDRVITAHGRGVEGWR